MYAVIWMGTSAMTAGFNLGENNLVQFLFEFCFDPNTLVVMKDGSSIPISDIHIGDELAAVVNDSGVPTYPVVTSVFRFSGSRTPLVKIDDVVMSSEHYVLVGGSWIPAKMHPSAAAVPSLPELVCLNVSGHAFGVGLSGLIAADYDEHSSRDINRVAQSIAMLSLNGENSETDLIDEYDLGIDGSFFVRMADNTWKPIAQIELGEETWNAGRVLGKAKEQCWTTIRVNGNRFAEAQTVYDLVDKKWVRAGVLWPKHSVDGVCELYSLITEKCSTLQISGSDGSEYYIRDYREVPLNDMEEPYEAAFLSKNK